MPVINNRRNNYYEVPYMVYLTAMPKSIRFMIIEPGFLPTHVRIHAESVLMQKIRNTIPNAYKLVEYNSNQENEDWLVRSNFNNRVRLKNEVTGIQIKKIFEDLKNKGLPGYAKRGIYRVRKRINSSKRPASSTRSRSRSR